MAEAGKTLREASDIIWEGWVARTHSEDISAEKWTDTHRGVERIYDPDTGEVYEVPAGWYEDYVLHTGEYDVGDLEPLSAEAWELWMKAALDGSSRIHQGGMDPDGRLALKPAQGGKTSGAAFRGDRFEGCGGLACTSPGNPLPLGAPTIAGVAKLADATDLKSVRRKAVRVRLPPPAPVASD